MLRTLRVVTHNRRRLAVRVGSTEYENYVDAETRSILACAQTGKLAERVMRGRRPKHVVLKLHDTIRSRGLPAVN